MPRRSRRSGRQRLVSFWLKQASSSTRWHNVSRAPRNSRVQTSSCPVGAANLPALGRRPCPHRQAGELLQPRRTSSKYGSDQINPGRRGRRRVAFCKDSPRNHARRGVSGRGSAANPFRGFMRQPANPRHHGCAFSLSQSSGRHSVDRRHVRRVASLGRSRTRWRTNPTPSSKPAEAKSQAPSDDSRVFARVSRMVGTRARV